MKSFSSQYFYSLVKTWDKMGLPSAESMEFLGLSAQDLKNPKYRVPLDQIEQILQFAGKRLDIANIGLETAFEFRILSVGQMGSVLSYCNSIADAAVFNIQFSSLIETIGTPSFERRADGNFIVWKPHFTDNNKYKHVTELVVGGYIVTTNLITWFFEKSLMSISFQHNAPDDVRRHREICLCPVKFDQEENRLEIHPDYVDRPFPSANPEKLEKAKTILSNVQRSSVHQAKLVVNSFAAIKKAIHENDLSTRTIAKALNMSERTFRRRLLAEGLTYRNLVDEVRQSMCRECMAQNLPFTEIAQRLGFNDQSAFTRAFRKWYGTAPSNYRAMYFTI